MDFQKAFDSVAWFVIHLALRVIRIPIKFINYLRQLRINNKQIVFNPFNFNIRDTIDILKLDNSPLVFTAINGTGQGGTESPFIWSCVSSLLLNFVQYNKLHIHSNTKEKLIQ